MLTRVSGRYSRGQLLVFTAAGLAGSPAGIWLEQQYFPGRPIFNTGQVLTIPGLLDLDLFRRALSATVAECPGLSVPPDAPPTGTDLSILDLRRDPDPDAAAQVWMQAELAV